ncbi:hypothetical protein J6590_034819 [Homalodisca vitripennis]|nr:hypothetical protein J6590_034819 [Homalodisca vitripennis]
MRVRNGTLESGGVLRTPRRAEIFVRTAYRRKIGVQRINRIPRLDEPLRKVSITDPDSRCSNKRNDNKERKNWKQKHRLARVVKCLDIKITWSVLEASWQCIWPCSPPVCLSTSRPLPLSRHSAFDATTSYRLDRNSRLDTIRVRGRYPRNISITQISL